MRQRKIRGVSNVFEGNFFVPSPTANLVGIDEEGHERFSERGCEVECASQPLCLFGRRFVFFDKKTNEFLEILLL